MRTTSRPAAERARRAFDLIAAHKRLSNVEIGKRTELGTTKIQARRSGETLLSIDDIGLLADALDVPVELFWMNEPEILHWLAEHRDPGAQGHIVTYVDPIDNIRPICAHSSAYNPDWAEAA